MVETRRRPRAPARELMTAAAAIERPAALPAGVAHSAKGMWRARHVALLAGVGAVEGALRMAAPRDGDIFWGAQSGVDTFRTGVPRHDSYSWAVPGHSWIPSSWGWNVMLGALYDAFGMAGFVVAALGLGAMFGVVLAFVARQAGARPMPALLTFAIIGAFALAGAPRATAVSTLVAPLALVPLKSILDAPRREALRAFGLLLALQITWINLHSGGLVGPALTAAAGTGFLLRRRTGSGRDVTHRLFGTVVAQAAACLATPYGWSLIAHAPKVRAASVNLIEEWQHYTLSMLLTPTGIASAAALSLSAWSLGTARRYERLLPLLVVLAMALSAIRFTPMVLVFIAPELALALGRLSIRDVFLRVAAAAVSLGMVGACVTGLANFRHVEEMWGSPRLVDQIPSGCRLFNDDVSGGMVILLRRDVPVWTDGRNDMYGRARVIRTLDVLNWAPGSAQWLARERVTCALVPKSDHIVQALAQRPGWRIADSDSSRALLLRSPSG